MTTQTENPVLTAEEQAELEAVIAAEGEANQGNPDEPHTESDNAGPSGVNGGEADAPPSLRETLDKQLDDEETKLKESLAALKHRRAENNVRTVQMEIEIGQRHGHTVVLRRQGFGPGQTPIRDENLLDPFADEGFQGELARFARTDDHNRLIGQVHENRYG